jgi:Ca2+-transporting ATPase
MSEPARQGLSSDEARTRLLASGPNEITQEAGTPAWKLLARQFTSVLVLLLLVACVISAALREVVDSIAIAAIVVLNGFIGFYQEYSAQNAVLALRAMTAPRARVRRDGRTVEVPAADVVVGDALVLEAGDVVAADARLFEAHALATAEAALTGESLPVDKSTEPIAEDAPLADRTDRVFLGTAVTAGTGVAEVIATGMATELGRIAGLLLDTAQEDPTPLQVQLAQGRALDDAGCASAWWRSSRGRGCAEGARGSSYS